MPRLVVDVNCAVIARPQANTAMGVDEYLANARLIAAAPTMREALYEMIDGTDDANALVVRIRALLAHIDGAI